MARIPAIPPKFNVSTGTIYRIADNIAKKELAPTSLSFKQWKDEIPNQIKQRVFFSSKLKQAQHLSDIKKKLIANLEGQKIQVRESAAGRKYWEEKGLLDAVNPDTGRKYGDEYVFQSRSQITRDLIELAKQRGIAATGTRYAEEDQKRPERVDVIFSYNIKTAVNTANYNASMDDDVLNYFVAWEFGRLSQSEVPRDWDARWDEAGSKCGWVGASRSKKIALKTSDIWANLNKINPSSPVPPFDWNSGMGFLREVSRGEAEQLGILNKGEKLAPKLIDLNAKTMADITDLEPYTLDQIKKEMGDKITTVKGRTFWNA